MAFHSARSAPVLKARPDPVNTATKREGSSSNHLKMFVISMTAEEGVAFSFWGRDMVARRTWGDG